MDDAKWKKTQDIHSTFWWWWCDDVKMTPRETTYITTKVKQNKKTPGCVRLYAKKEKENEVRSIHSIYQVFNIWNFEWRLFDDTIWSYDFSGFTQLYMVYIPFFLFLCIMVGPSKLNCENVYGNFQCIFLGDYNKIK